jgi:APA family basic amino acid/polyamine antiporter
MGQSNAQNVNQDSKGEARAPQKSLNFWALVSKGLGGTIGGPIFVILGTVILTAQAGSLISLAISGILMLSFVMNFSEIALSLPISGGSYSFSKEAIGGLRGFLIGWLIWVGNLLFAALSGLGFSLSITTFLPNRNMPQLAINIIGIFIIGIIYLLNLRKPRLLSKIMIILTFILVGGFVIYIIVGLILGSQLNSEFSPQIFQEELDFSSILTMTAFTFVIYCVYEWNSTFESLTGEFDRIKQPRKNIPRAFIGALLIGIVIYWLTTLVTLFNIGSPGSADWEKIVGSKAPLADTFALIINHPFGIYFMGFIGMVATLTSINAGLQMGTHVLHAMARDKFVPKVFQKEKNNIQWVALTGSSVITFIIASFAEISLITEISNFIFLVSMFVLSLSVILLRKSRPNLIRPWKVPLYPLTPIFSMVSSLILIGTMIFSNISSSSFWGVMVGVLIVIIGLFFYFFKIARRDRIFLMLAGIKGGINFLLIVVLVGLRLSFEHNGKNYPIINILLIVISIYGICSLIFDILPMRKIIAMVAGRNNEVVVVSGIFQLSDKQDSFAQKINRTLGTVLLTIGLVCVILSPFVLSDFFIITSPYSELVVENSKFLSRLVFIVVLMQGFIFFIQSLLKFFQEYEILQVH